MAVSKGREARRELAQRARASRQRRPATVRTLALLEAVARARAPVGLAELARSLALPAATVFRLCQTLEDAGYVVRAANSRRYTVSAKLMRLGMDVVRAGSGAGPRRDILEALVERVGETCNLTMLAGTEVLYLDRVETRWPLRLTLEPGSRVPLHCTASGKLFLAMLPAPARAAVLDALSLVAHTPKTLTTRADLERDLKRIARRGYSTDEEEFLAGLIAVAVPVVDEGGSTLAAIACHAPVARLELKAAVGLVPLLREAATKIAATF